MGIRENGKWGYTSQKEWGWPAAIEIFCGGTAGGTYILSALPHLLFSGRIFLTGVYASLFLVLISVFVLVAESTFLRRLPRAFLYIKSPLALGAISLSLLIIFSIATLGIMHTGLAPLALYVVVWLGVTVSLLTIIYPGILMGFMRAIPFWSGSGPSLLLLCASLLSGSAVVTLVGGLGHVDFDLSQITLWLLVIYGLFLSICIIQAGQGPRAAQISVQRLIKGKLFLIFIIGVVAMGLVAPFVLFIMGTIPSSASMPWVGSVLILIGGILMRYSLIASGVKMSLLSEDSIAATYWLYH